MDKDIVEKDAAAPGKSNKKRSRKRKNKNNPTEGTKQQESKEPCKPSSKKKKDSRPAAPRPNVFTALQVTDAAIHKQIRAIQVAALESDESLREFLVSANKAHVTLHAFYADEDRLDDVISALRCAVAKWERQSGGGDDEHCALRMTFDGLGTFGGKVVFAKVAGDDIGDLQKFYDVVTHEIDCVGLEGVKLGRDFQPHLTLMKLSRAKSKAGRKRKQIEAEHYHAFETTTLGSQTCRSLQLLSMTRRQDPKTGYYSKIAEIPFSQGKPSDQDLDHTSCCFTKIGKVNGGTSKSLSAATAARGQKDVVKKTLRKQLQEMINVRNIGIAMRSPRTLFVCSLLAFASYKLRNLWMRRNIQ